MTKISELLFTDLTGIDTFIIEKPFLSGPDLHDTPFYWAGAIQLLAEGIGAKIVWQRPNVPEFIQRRFNTKGRGRCKTQHEFDAVAHAAFWWYHTFDEGLQSDTTANLVVNRLRGSYE